VDLTIAQHSIIAVERLISLHEDNKLKKTLTRVKGKLDIKTNALIASKTDTYPKPDMGGDMVYPVC
jgi:hypothetical protein